MIYMGYAIPNIFKCILTHITEKTLKLFRTAAWGGKASSLEISIPALYVPKCSQAPDKYTGPNAKTA